MEVGMGIDWTTDQILSQTRDWFMIQEPSQSNQASNEQPRDPPVFQGGCLYHGSNLWARNACTQGNDGELCGRAAWAGMGRGAFKSLPVPAELA